MADDPNDSTRFSLRRWSQRKLDAARRTAPDAGDPARAAPAARPRDLESTTLHAPEPGAVDAPPARSAGQRASPSAPAVVATPGDPATLSQLPPLDSLTIDSDYTAFMRPGVDASLKRGALRKLFSDPRFNVMDGLDVYIDDYSKPDPIDPAIVRTLAQARYIFNPPPTRVNEQGYVADVPESELQVAGASPLEPGDRQATLDAPPAEAPFPTGADAPAPVRTATAEPVQVDAVPKPDPQ
jgi:hypothetical protein